MKRYTHKQCIAFEPETADKIDALKQRFGLKFSEVVRECVESDLPRLIRRHTQAKQQGRGRIEITENRRMK